MKPETQTAAKPKREVKASSKNKRIVLPEINSKGEKLTKTGRAFGILKGKIIINTNCL
jgi:hypothetical protein